MKSSSAAAESPKRLRAVERLAQRLYEQSNPGPKPWLRLGWDVREAWLLKARNSLESSTSSLDRFYFWRPAKSLRNVG
jgi:hypothetical protein